MQSEKKKNHKYKATYSRGGKQCCKGKKNHMDQETKEEYRSDDTQSIRIQKLRFSPFHIKGIFFNLIFFF